ncbi:MAG: HigA family addiction module antidote protein [Synergistaceae bacterium]|nr:HigA family addiction module antidote protein [Synergistaceae bacterium]
MQAAGLAKTLYIPTNRVSQILSGKRSISADTAVRLGKFFPTGPHFWLNLQGLRTRFEKGRGARHDGLKAINFKVGYEVTGPASSSTTCRTPLFRA